MTTAGPGGSTACIPLEAVCSAALHTPFLPGGIFDETGEKPIRRLSAADPTPFLHDTLTDTAIAAMEKRNEYLRFCREISTISIPDLSLPRQMRRGNRKGIRGAATVPSSLRSSSRRVGTADRPFACPFALLRCPLTHSSLRSSGALHRPQAASPSNAPLGRSRVPLPIPDLLRDVPGDREPARRSLGRRSRLKKSGATHSPQAWPLVRSNADR